MKFSKDNIFAACTFIREYNSRIPKLERDALCSVGRFSIGRANDGATPRECSPIDCGNVSTVAPCINYLDSTEIRTLFKQNKYGIVWQISRKTSKRSKETTLFSGIIADRGLLSDKPVSDLVAEGMMKVALLAEKVIKLEKEAMYI